MSFAITRRSALLGTLGLLGGCGSFGIPDPPPDFDPPQLGAGDDTRLDESTAIICGTGFSAWMSELALGRRDFSVDYGEDRPHRFIFTRDGGGPAHRIWLTRAMPRGLRQDDGLVATEITPFAFRLPAGRYTIRGLQFYGVSRVIVRSNSYAPREISYNWFSQPIPPLSFDALAGQVSLVGQFGYFSGAVPFADQSTAGSVCRAPDRVVVPALRSARCVFERVVHGPADGVARDLVRQRFPRLGEANIIDAAPARPPRGWMSWPEARRDPLQAGLDLRPA